MAKYIYQSNSGCAFCSLLLIVFILIWSIPSLIYALDYYPLTEISLKQGYCKNMVETVSIVNTLDGLNYGIYYYNIDVYDNINGTFVGTANGCWGTEENSYVISAGIISPDTQTYPYSGYLDNVPAWLCSHLNKGSAFWKKLKNSKTSWKPWSYYDTTWVPCQYGSLSFAKQSPWNVKGVAHVGTNDFMSIIPIYESKYKELKETDHYYATIISAYVFQSIVVAIICMILCCSVDD